MGQTISPATGQAYGLQRVCAIWGVPRASIYRRQKQADKLPGKRGRKPTMRDSKLLEYIREDISKSPFKGEGHRKTMLGYDEQANELDVTRC